MTRRRLLRSLLPAVMLLAAALPSWAQKGDTAEDWTRQEMAVALLRALGTPDFTPPDCVPGQEMFDDVPASDPFCRWIEELARRGITGGCGGGNYCPAAPVSRAQMATFLVKTQFPAVVPAGVTVTGGWGFDVHSTDGTGDWGTFISYPAPMPETLQVAYVEAGQDPPEPCLGTWDLPTAAPGFLCVYEHEEFNTSFLSINDNSPFGTTIFFAPGSNGDMLASGSWAATAPVE